MFIRIANFLYRRIAQATGSWTSHVGIVIGRDAHDYRIAESTVPWSRTTSLTAFIRRSEHRRFVIKRFRGGLNANQQQAIVHSAMRRMGVPYHLGFDFDSNWQFCSKLVYEVYLDALGIELAAIETFDALLARNPGLDLAFWRVYFAGRIPRRRRTVTPASLVQCAQLVTVAEGGNGTRCGVEEVTRARPAGARRKTRR